jgi:hypothetical protein
MDDLDIEILDATDPISEAALRDALYQFNFQATGYRDGRSLSCFLRETDGRLVAGIDGFSWGS